MINVFQVESISLDQRLWGNIRSGSPIFGESQLSQTGQFITKKRFYRFQAVDSKVSWPILMACLLQAAEICKVLMSLNDPNSRLQPSLLDRLRDDNPEATTEAVDQQVISLAELRELILRDLAWLLNCDNLDCVEDLSNLPDVRNSVLNYGIPSFSGTTLSTTDSASLEREVRNAILAFEPRILPRTLMVRSVMIDAASHGRKTIALEIGGAIWARPFSLEFLLRSEMDLDTGHVVITEIQNHNY